MQFTNNNDHSMIYLALSCHITRAVILYYFGSYKYVIVVLWNCACAHGSGPLLSLQAENRLANLIIK